MEVYSSRQMSRKSRWCGVPLIVMEGEHICSISVYS